MKFSWQLIFLCFMYYVAFWFWDLMVGLEMGSLLSVIGGLKSYWRFRDFAVDFNLSIDRQSSDSNNDNFWLDFCRQYDIFWVTQIMLIQSPNIQN
jgi:hypothetical protein